MKKIKSSLSGFTIVELLVVIVVIGILAAIITVAYTGVSQKATAASLQSDLTTASNQLKMYQVDNGEYPSSNDCSATPAAKSICLKSSSGNTLSYTPGVGPSPQTFSLTANNVNTSIAYIITENSTPTLVSSLPYWKKIAASENHTCAIASDDKAYCWGYNGYGQLGDGTTIDKLTPVAVATSGVLSGKTIKSISTGNRHTCVIASDDKAYCWGSNAYGRLGDSTTTNRSVPVAVTTSGVLSGKTVKSITANNSYSCAIASDDKVYCWGYNVNGQLGDATTVNKSSPVAVDTSGVLSGKTVKSISDSTDYFHMCAIASDDKAYCWGYNGSGQLGDNTIVDKSSPVAVSTSGVLSGKTIKSISVDQLHSCAIASDDKAYCWGSNSYGQLGDNTGTNRIIPVAVYSSGALSGKTVKSISLGQLHSCAIASDDKAYCWGFGSMGQLGNNLTPDAYSPSAVFTGGVLSGKTIMSITSGVSHTCAIASDQQAYCWGYNTYGQLGDNTTNQSLAPVSVTPLN